jgi:hypothetical protein
MGAWFLLAAALLSSPSPGQWKSAFDGKSLDGWTASQGHDNGSWSVREGTIWGEGPAGQLVYTLQNCINCEISADVHTNAGTNAGISVRGGPGGQTGYETPVNNTSTSSPVHTGGLYAGTKVLRAMTDQRMPDDAWFNERIVIEGNHIQVFVDGKQTADIIDENNTYLSGSIAFQKYDRGSVLQIKNVMVRDLAAPESPLAGRWQLNREQSKSSGGDLPSQLEMRIAEERDGLRIAADGVTADGRPIAINAWARTDGEDYVLRGANEYDHVSFHEATYHRHVHEALLKAKLRKKRDDRAFDVDYKLGWKQTGQAVFVVSADGRKLTIDGTITRDTGDVHFTEVLGRID